MAVTRRFRSEVDDAVERSARPAAVRAALERLHEVDADLPARLQDPSFRAALIGVLAASRSLSRWLEHTPDALAVLERLDDHRPFTGTDRAALAEWYRSEFLRVTARDLAGLDDLEATTDALSGAADDVLHNAALMTERRPGETGRWPGVRALAVISMGKLGGRELNYASDVDVIFVGDGPPEDLERRARAAVAAAATCFRVDTNLRPLGRDGPLVRSLESFEAYWDRWAEPWELQALLKARWVGGDAALGAHFTATAQRWLWSHPLDADALRAIRQMKRRTENTVYRLGLADREIKRGRGGIRDIEFTVQLLQLVHGHADAALRGGSTLGTLRELAGAGYVDPHDADRLREAYRFLRTVEHRLQLEDEQQVHTVPSDPQAVERLARVLGFRGRREAGASEQFQRTLVHHQNAVRTIHERIYFRPLLEAFGRRDGRFSGVAPEVAAARLSAFGFTDAQRTRAAIEELTRGLTRSSRLMQQMLPLLLDWLSTAPNPDLGLLMLRNLLAGKQRALQVVAAFRDSAESAQRTCTVLGTSRWMGEMLVHHPELVPLLPGDGRPGSPPVELTTSVQETVRWRRDPHSRQAALRRWKERHVFGVAARDVLGSASVEDVGADLTAVAEASLQAALESLQPQVRFGVLALGRFGGAELSYASDLDVIFVFDGDGHGGGDADEASRVASGLLRVVGGATPAEQLYAIDADLRPEGRQGPLARSVEGFVHYWEHYALVWERQAMVRARPVAGDLALGHRLLKTLEPHIWDPNGLSSDEIRSIRRMKARIERERIPFGEDPQFHLKLGRGSLSDIEFSAQLLQLQHGIRRTGTMAALRALVDAGVLDDGDADILMTSYRFCEQTRNRWFLVSSKPGNSLPGGLDELSWLARSLDLTPTDLRERYRRVTRRARRVVERVFYGAVIACMTREHLPVRVKEAPKHQAQSRD